MSSENAPPKDWPRLVSEVLEEARRHAGNGPLLAEELQRLGVGPEGRYSESAISNWVKGRAMPPADVLMAAADFGGISLDDKLGATPTGESATDPRVASLQEALAEVMAELAQLRDQVQGLILPELEQQGQLMAQLLAARDSGAEAPAGITRRTARS